MKTIATTTLGAGILALLFSCQTPPVYEVQGDRVQSFSEAGVSVKAEFLPESELRRRYGERYNPFIGPKGSLFPDNYLVFEVTVSTESNPALMQLNQVELQFRDKTKHPWNAFQFTDAWKTRTDTDGISKSAERSRLSLIKEHIPQSKYTVPAGAGKSFLYLFRGNFPKYGEADLYIPVLGTDERPIAMAEFRYEF